MKKTSVIAFTAMVVMLSGCVKKPDVPVEYSGFHCVGSWNEYDNAFEISLYPFDMDSETYKTGTAEVKWFWSSDGKSFEQYGETSSYAEKLMIVPDERFEVNLENDPYDRKLSQKIIRAEVKGKDGIVHIAAPLRIMWDTEYHNGFATLYDSDEDGLVDVLECQDENYDPFNPDSDGDGISDYDEWYDFSE